MGPEPEWRTIDFDTDSPPEALAGHLRALAGRVATGGTEGHVLIEHCWSRPVRLRACGLDPRWVGLSGPGASGGRGTSDPWEPPVSDRRSSQFLLAGAADGGAPEAFGRFVAAPSTPEPDPTPAALLPEGIWMATQVHWAPDGGGALRVALRAWIAGGTSEAARSSAVATILDRLAATGTRAAARLVPFRRRYQSEWRDGSWRRLRPELRWNLEAPAAVRLGLIGGLSPPPDPAEGRRHTLVFGASGSGKSAHLAAAARDRIHRGQAVVVLDVHGDLSGRILAGLDAPDRARVVGIDPTVPGPIPGLRLLGSASSRSADSERAHLIAALRRLGQEDGTMYWGFRLDRIFDVLLRVVQEQRGDLRDLYALLTDPGRRELARRATRSREVAQFLEELPALIRRNPEFLWPAAARLSRIVLTPPLLALVAPSGPELPAREILDGGGALLWRLPIADLGPEGAQLLSTLILSHLYLDRAAALGGGPTPVTEVTIILDEAQLVGPHLLAELFAEGRKFGLAVVAATQYPERLEEEARWAASGAVGTHVVFRSPQPHAARLAGWVGLGREEAEQILPRLPSGTALRVSSGPGSHRSHVVLALEPTPAPDAWPEAVRHGQEAYGAEIPREEAASTEAEESVLLELLFSAEHGPGLTPASGSRGSPSEEPVLAALRTRGEIAPIPGGYTITDRGRWRLGFHEHTGATRESAAHRALLLEAFLIFARHGHRIQILRQGRFDARLPDATLRWLEHAPAGCSPAELAEAFDRWRTTWAWRYAGGRDIHLEAEVSGADRPERIRYDLRKGRTAGAHVLFLVGDPGRAGKVRRALGATGASRTDWSVWTLRTAPRRTGP